MQVAASADIPTSPQQRPIACGVAPSPSLPSMSSPANSEGISTPSSFRDYVSAASGSGATGSEPCDCESPVPTLSPPSGFANADAMPTNGLSFQPTIDFTPQQSLDALVASPSDANGGLLVYSAAYLQTFSDQSANPKIVTFFQQKHPCDRYFHDGCKYDDKCHFKDFPRDWCVPCLLGEPHKDHKTVRPPTHPCLRVWGSCKYEDKCVFKDYPRVWCLFCLRGAKHAKCSGIKPKSMPVVPNEVSEQCAQHERRVSAQQQRLPLLPPRRNFETPAVTSPTASKRRGSMGSRLERMEQAMRDRRASTSSIPMARTTDSVAAMFASLQSTPTLAQPDFPIIDTSLQAQPQQPAELPNRANKPFGRKEAAIDMTESVARQCRGVLNKLTPEKFDRLRVCFVDVLVKSIQQHPDRVSDILAVAAKETFEKALAEQNNSAIYARLASMLEQSLQQQQENLNVGATELPRRYRRNLLELCQQQFQSPPPESCAPLDELEKYRRRAKANTHFVGELYVNGSITLRVVNSIVNSLLGEASSQNAPLPLEIRIELFVALMEACGGVMEQRAGVEHVKSLMAVLKARRSSVVLRVQFMIDSLLALRENGWRHKVVMQ